MGSVLMDARSTGIHEGYTTSVGTYYLYCDKCGSFDITRRFTLATWFKIVVALAALVGAVVWISLDKERWLCFFWLGFAFFFMFLPVAGDLFRELDLRCRKCGNRQITHDDVLNYGERDRHSILDVSGEKAIKYEASDW